MTSDIIELQTMTVQLKDDQIIHISVHRNAKISKKDAEELLRVIVRISAGKLYPLLIDAGYILAVDRDARLLFSQTTSISAVALCVKTPLSKIIGNFFIGLNRTPIPFKLFTSITDAVPWLKTTTMVE